MSLLSTLEQWPPPTSNHTFPTRTLFCHVYHNTLTLCTHDHQLIIVAFWRPAFVWEAISAKRQSLFYKNKNIAWILWYYFSLRYVHVVSTSFGIDYRFQYPRSNWTKASSHCFEIKLLYIKCIYVYAGFSTIIALIFIPEIFDVPYPELLTNFYLKGHCNIMGRQLAEGWKTALNFVTAKPSYSRYQWQ